MTSIQTQPGSEGVVVDIEKARLGNPQASFSALARATVLSYKVELVEKEIEAAVESAAAPKRSGLSATLKGSIDRLLRRETVVPETIDQGLIPDRPIPVLTFDILGSILSEPQIYSRDRLIQALSACVGASVWSTEEVPDTLINLASPSECRVHAEALLDCVSSGEALAKRSEPERALYAWLVGWCSYGTDFAPRARELLLDFVSKLKEGDEISRHGVAYRRTVQILSLCHLNPEDSVLYSDCLRSKDYRLMTIGTLAMCHLAIDFGRAPDRIGSIVEPLFDQKLEPQINKRFAEELVPAVAYALGSIYDSVRNTKEEEGVRNKFMERISRLNATRVSLNEGGGGIVDGRPFSSLAERFWIDSMMTEIIGDSSKASERALKHVAKRRIDGVGGFTPRQADRGGVSRTDHNSRYHPKGVVDE